MEEMELQWTEAIGRNVMLRPHTMDRQVWSDTYVGLYHVPPAGPHPSNVLDLGCNIGLTIAHYQAMWPNARIVGVEMDPDCATLAGINAPNSMILERAIGGERRVGTYNPYVRSDSFTLGSPGCAVEVYDLKTTIIDSFGENSHVDFLKMDIESAEWEVFAEGSWAQMVSSILVELHDSGTSAEIVQRGIDALNNLGYRAEHHVRHPQAVFARRI